MQPNKFVCVQGRRYDKSLFHQRYAAGWLRSHSPVAYSGTKNVLAEIAVHNLL